MVALVPPTRIGQLLKLLPRPLVAALDAWSARRARQRAAARRARWQDRRPAS